MINRLIRLTITVILSTILLTFICCEHHSEAWNKMNLAESLMETRPDSALSILNGIALEKSGYRKELARFALLKSIALDKNYVDTTNFDVLQPAIDYFLKQGSPDEKLKTYYYQGRIYQNRGDYDKAMQSFFKGAALFNEVSDSLTYANLLVAQGSIYYCSYQIDSFISNNLCAAKIYEDINRPLYRFSSLLKGLLGSIIQNDKNRADSIIGITRDLANESIDLKMSLETLLLTYNIRFGSESEIRNIISNWQNLSEINDELKLDVCQALLKLGNNKQAKILFESIANDSLANNSLRYFSVKSDILQATGNYDEALKAYREFSSAVEKENSRIYFQKTTVAKERHDMVLENIYINQRKNKYIWLSLSCILMMIIVSVLLYYKLRIGKAKRLLIEKENERLSLSNTVLLQEKNVLELAKKNSDLECERQILVAENLKNQINLLEEESDRLKDLLKKNELSQPINKIIKERIEILNGLLAAQITENDSYSKPYDDWIRKITEDKTVFMNSARLAFKASHANFIKYLEDHGLNDYEINYACLYALGLRGKEIGTYIQIRRHYHISSDIRKKLGMKEQDTNLGIHIRNLMNDL